ncbi:MAG: hypothetical protein ACOCXQ_04045 [Patescibacteria group bacterium]
MTLVTDVPSSDSMTGNLRIIKYIPLPNGVYATLILSNDGSHTVKIVNRERRLIFKENFLTEGLLLLLNGEVACDLPLKTGFIWLESNSLRITLVRTSQRCSNEHFRNLLSLENQDVRILISFCVTRTDLQWKVSHQIRHPLVEGTYLWVEIETGVKLR